MTESFLFLSFVSPEQDTRHIAPCPRSLNLQSCTAPGCQLQLTSVSIAVIGASDGAFFVCFKTF